MSKSKHEFSLTSRQKAILEHLSRRSTSPQRLVKRAEIILAVARGTPKRQTAREQSLDKKTVKKWCKRWYEASSKLLAIESENISEKRYADKIINILNDAPRSGAPAEFTPEQVVQVIDIACEVIDDSDKPVSRWTHQEIAQEAIDRKIVKTISSSSVGRFLKRSSYKTA